MTTSLTDTRSSELYRQAVELMPGGVNSPVRAMRSIGRDPIFIARGEGAELVDVDGNRFLDYVCSWGPLIHGHAHPRIVAAVAEAAARGTSFGAPTPGEVELAQEVTRRFDGVDMLRMTSSGTEATMTAIRLARAATGREHVLKFAGAYHGHVDGLLVQAGLGAGHERAAREPRRSARSAAARTVARAVERSAGTRRGGRRARARRDHRRAAPGEHGPRPAARRDSSSCCASRPTRAARCSSSTR